MDEFEQGLSNAKEKFDAFTSNMQKVGEKVLSTGGTLAKKVTLPLVGLGTAAIKTGMDYEAGMSKVQAISGATSSEMDKLGEKAMEMAAKTKFSTADSAEAYQYMAMAGWKAGDMVDGLSGIMNLAAASGENLGTTSDIVTDALTAFGLKASDSGRFADVLAAASNNANTNVSMLGESFKYVAPVAGALGYSVEDTSVALGLMANSGIKASQAGTSLRTAMTNMASPTREMQKVMEQYGISLTDADGNMLSFSEIMEVLRERMGGLDEATQATAASHLFGKEAMSGMLAIINAAPEDFDKLTEAINNSSGTTEKMASIMQDNAAGAFERLKSAVDVLFTKLSESLLPIFTSVVETVTEVVNWFGNLDKGTQELILTIAGIAAAVGPVLVVVGNLITAVGQIGSGITGLIGIVSKAGGAFSGLFSLLAANPIALVVVAVAGLVAAFVGLWNNCEGFRNFWIGLWDNLKSVVSTAIDAIVGFFGGIVGFIKSNWQGLLLMIVNPFAGAFKLIYDNCEAFREFVDGLMDAVGAVFAAGWEAVKGFFVGAWEAVQSVWGAAVDFFTGIGDGIRGIFEAVTGFLGDIFAAAWEAVQSVWNAATGFFSGLWDKIKGVAETAGIAIGGAFSKAWDAVSSAWNGAMNFFAGIRDKIVGVFSNIGGKFLEIGGNIVKGLWDGIARAWDGFIGFITSKVGGIVSAVKNMLGIHSPSKVFAGIGGNMALGLADGWDDKYGGIKRKIENGLNFGTATVGVNANCSNMARYGAQEAPQAGRNGWGNTYVTINSPEAVDGVQATREWQKTAQRMALGYV